MSYGVNFCILALLIITPTKLAFIKVILYSSYHDIILYALIYSIMMTILVYNVIFILDKEHKS